MTKTTNTQVVSPAAQESESGTFTKRIGSTIYRVNVHFSKSSKETAKDKILRLVNTEYQNKKAAASQ